MIVVSNKAVNGTQAVNSISLQRKTVIVYTHNEYILKKIRKSLIIRLSLNSFIPPPQDKYYYARLQ